MAAQPPQLVALSEGPNILLDKPIMLIGRHQECDIQIPSRKVSRRHCCIAQVDDHIVVRDLCSTNGIRVNGVRVQEGQLNSGDELTIGNFRYQLSYGLLPAQVSPGVPVAGVPVMNVPRHVDNEEDPFDSCEEPIALAEPDEAPPHGSGHSQASPSPPAALGRNPPSAFPPSLIFPDNIKLAPLSDFQMPPPK
jgi:predicted component of type VI protein secretion system